MKRPSLSLSSSSSSPVPLPLWLFSSALLCLLPLQLAAQPAAPATAAASAPAAAASAAREANANSKLPQRRLPAAQAHERSTMPGDLRPPHPVAPLFSIPLGRSEPPASKPLSRAPRPGLGASAAGADSPLRCGMASDEGNTAACRETPEPTAPAVKPG